MNPFEFSIFVQRRSSDFHKSTKSKIDLNKTNETQPGQGTSPQQGTLSHTLTSALKNTFVVPKSVPLYSFSI